MKPIQKTGLAELFSAVSDIRGDQYHGVKDNSRGYSKFVAAMQTIPTGRLWIRTREPQSLWQIPKIALLLDEACIIHGCGGPSLTLNMEHRIGESLTIAVPNEYLPRLQKGPVWPGLVSFQPSVVRTWQHDAEDLINDGRVIYVPDRVIMLQGPDKNGRPSWDTLPLNQTIPENVILRPRGTASQNDAALVGPKTTSAKSLVALLDVALPFISQLDLQEWYKLYCDNQDSAVLLRKALKQSLLVIQEELAKDASPPRIAQLAAQLKGDTIQPELSKLNLAYERILKTKALTMAGATISTVALAAGAILVPSVAASVAVLGGAGMLATVREYADYRKEEKMLSENPYYLLWKMQRPTSGLSLS